MDVTPRLLGGRYELGPLLGYGGMAEVYRGRDVRLGREVAVKVLRSDLARDPSFQARFRREAQSAAALSHPNVVSVYDTGEDVSDAGAPVPYIVMEYVDGRTLRDVLQTEGRMLPRRAVEVVAEVCRALDYSHQAGIVHRDVKPGNVMLTRTGAVKVMDFGIARALAASSATVTQTAAVVGTAQYLSPEQARGEAVDARSDVYSTGCLLYELLTGRPPFVGDSPVAVAYQHVREDAVPPSRLVPDLAPDLDAVVLKAMAKNPGNRYQTAGQMADDLDRVVHGQRVSATPVMTGMSAATTQYLGAPAAATTVMTVPEAPPLPPRRGRGWAYALLALAVIGVFVAAALVVRSLSGGSSTPTAGQVPNLVGKKLADAKALLVQDGFTVGKTDPQYVNDEKRFPKDTVLSQSIVPGISFTKGGAVDLTYSAGRETTQVPGGLVGMTQQQATDALTQAKLKAQVSTSSSTDPTVPAGQVLAVNPGDGSTLPVGSTVVLRVADGKGLVPDVSGQTVESASRLLQQAGFSLGGTRSRGLPVGDRRNGLVVATDPAARSSLAYGSPVTLVVGSAAAPPTSAPPSSPSAPPATSAAPAPSDTPASSPAAPPPTTGLPTP